jgi:hypothetical protein
MPEFVIVRQLIALLRSRLQAVRERPEAGYSTEFVIVTALVAAAAITVVGIIIAKVVTAAHGISTGTATGG